MQIGFNNDVEHRGKTFHIQTEDRGLPAAQIETQIFCGGAILDTTIIPYRKVMDAEPDGDAQIQKIRTMMQAAHRNFYKKLKAGDYDAMVGLEPVATVPFDDVDDFAPGQDRIPSSALEVERNPETFALGRDMGEAVDLSKLKEKLGGAGLDHSDADEVSSPIFVATPEPMNRKVSADVSALRRPSMSSSPSLPGIPDFLPTGRHAWGGCVAPKDDLSIVPLVEAFLAAS